MDWRSGGHCELAMTARIRLVSCVLGGVVLASVACSAEDVPGGSGGGAGKGGAPSPQAGSGGSGAPVAGVGGSSTAGAAVQGGTTSSAGSAAGGAGGAASAGTGGAALAGSGGAGGAGGSGPVVLAGCANNNYPLCLDFESGIDTATWTNGTAAGVSTVDKAHGEHSYHAYNGAGVLTTTKLGTITSVLWGRFYLRMTPGAPGGHGNIVGAFDGGDWYELGWQFNGLMGVWHYGGGENPLRSHPDIVDKWYCVELLFDGTKTEMPKWWVDGQEAEYYMGEPNNQKPHLITQFDKLTIGFTSYAGLGLAKEPYGNNNLPVLTDMWLDDIAFDVKRIGCITQ